MEKIKCWKCETEVIRKLDDKSQFIIEYMQKHPHKIIKERYKDIETKKLKRAFCEECKKENEDEYKSDLDEYLRLKNKLMINRAIRKFENQPVDIYKYKDAINVVAEYAEKNREKFMSSDEMLAAIVLIHHRIQTKVQYKIKNHQVDFLLPGLKVALEIDGYMHGHSQLSDSRRDIEMRSELGDDWEVVRIPTKYLEQNAIKLPDAIRVIKEEKQKIRKENAGIIPEWYSKREKIHYKRLTK